MILSRDILQFKYYNYVTIILKKYYKSKKSIDNIEKMIDTIWEIETNDEYFKEVI